MHTNTLQANSPIKYFLLIFIISIPFFLLLGGTRLPLSVNLPVSALMFITPLLAASILSYRQYGLNGIKELLKKAFDHKKIKNKIWYVPALLLIPLIYFFAYAAMRLTGLPLPDLKIPFLMAPVFFIMYFIAATGEELGWMGYAIDPLQDRWGALKASLILGFVWAIWHIIPHWQQSHPVNWILWQSLYTVALRILIVWVYNNTGKSVFAAILVHTMDNVSWSLFPNYGSHYDPFFTGMIACLIAGIVSLKTCCR